MAAPGIIGTAVAHGSLRVDGASVLHNATLFDGSVVETGSATATMRLGKGPEVRLAENSRGTLYCDRLVLEKGSGELTSAKGFVVEANGLRVMPGEALSDGVIALKSDHSVEVAALAGDLRVTTSEGFILASLRPGRSMNFAQQDAGAAAPTSITGCLSKVDGAYFLTVAQTGVVYELTGQNLDNLVGKNVTVAGTPIPNEQPKGNAAGVITVSSATPHKGAGCSPTAGGAALGGMALGTKLLISGVAIGAATGTSMGIYETDSRGDPIRPAASF